MVEAYRKFMSEVAKFLNGTSVEQDVDDVIEFETYLANVGIVCIYLVSVSILLFTLLM